MAVDEEFGIAKKATIKPVKLKLTLQPIGINGVQIETSSALQAFENVLKDIKANRRQGKAVVNFIQDSAYTITVRGDAMIPEAMKKLQQLIGDIMKEDVPFVAAAGNSAQDAPEINTHPQLFEGPDFVIINIGTVNSDSEEAVFSQKGPHLSAHAFGEGITCRGVNGNEINNRGTSFAAPQVAGLAAYFLSLTSTDGPEFTQFLAGQIAAQVKEKMIKMARSIKTGGVPVIYNGAQEDLSCAFNKKRQDGTPHGILNCQQNIPSGGPLPSNIALAIRGANDIALNKICAAKFDGSSDANQMTFNPGSLTINVARTDTSKALQCCQKAILQIIETCVIGSNDYGGVLTVGGEKYNITNIVWPQNPLIPGADLGAPSTTPAPSSTRPALPPAQTVTTNGAVCVLLPGSVTPQCRPLETPTQNPAGINIHVEQGCISINGSPICAGIPEHEAYNVRTQNAPWFTTTIYANFKPDDYTWGNVNPGCKIPARWPANFGDIYFKADDRLYNSSGSKIWDECCTSSTTAQTTNPYGRKEVLTCDCIGFDLFGACIGFEVGNECGSVFRK
ncbi:peptidase S8/S53 domain-containing protein [Clohesyomyces aquaticus]|uniref:Peptidase S8/S53 domain-containing protein n=1 Tax=Clohesyomyces aquaticus TaxID=1231657 RepID=A0A1Y1ZGK1_9PLEO|nr:peptidase S8/S53 domain-containing protein [Clohesyomyces aquaticus]